MCALAPWLRYKGRGREGGGGWRHCRGVEGREGLERGSLMVKVLTLCCEGEREHSASRWRCLWLRRSPQKLPPLFAPLPLSPDNRRIKLIVSRGVLTSRVLAPSPPPRLFFLVSTRQLLSAMCRRPFRVCQSCVRRVGDNKARLSVSRGAHGTVAPRRELPGIRVRRRV